MPSTGYIASHAHYPVQHGLYGGSAAPTPYPVAGGYPAPPYPVQGTPYAAPYPSGPGPSMPQPYGASAPYPVAANPPPYDQVISHDGYQKQAPFNPHYGGN